MNTELQSYDQVGIIYEMLLPIFLHLAVYNSH